MPRRTETPLPAGEAVLEILYRKISERASGQIVTGGNVIMADFQGFYQPAVTKHVFLAGVRHISGAQHKGKGRLEPVRFPDRLLEIHFNLMALPGNDYFPALLKMPCADVNIRELREIKIFHPAAPSLFAPLIETKSHSSRRLSIFMRPTPYFRGNNASVLSGAGLTSDRTERDEVGLSVVAQRRSRIPSP